MTYAQQQERMKLAAEEFPSEFGLRAFPGKRFSISLAASYVTDDGVIMLYTQVKTGDDWLAFAKGTPQELREELTQ